MPSNLRMRQQSAGWAPAQAGGVCPGPSSLWRSLRRGWPVCWAASKPRTPESSPQVEETQAGQGAGLLVVVCPMESRRLECRALPGYVKFPFSPSVLSSAVCISCTHNFWPARFLRVLQGRRACSLICPLSYFIVFSSPPLFCLLGASHKCIGLSHPGKASLCFLHIVGLCGFLFFASFNGVSRRRC